MSRGSTPRAAAASSSELTRPCRVTVCSMPVAARAAAPGRHRRRSCARTASPGPRHLRVARSPIRDGWRGVTAPVRPLVWNGLVVMHAGGPTHAAAASGGHGELRVDVGRPRAGRAQRRDRRLPAVRLDPRGPRPARVVRRRVRRARPRPHRGPDGQPVGLVGRPRRGRAAGDKGVVIGSHLDSRARRRCLRRPARRGQRPRRGRRAAGRGVRARPADRRRQLRRRGGRPVRRRLRRLAGHHRRADRRPGPQR